jgi:predicted secreted protein
MSLPLSLAVYFTVWWVTLFAVLPWGVRSSAEAGGTDAPPGSDQGAPVVANIGKKALATTVVAAIVFALIDAYVFYVGGG